MKNIKGNFLIKNLRKIKNKLQKFLYPAGINFNSLDILAESVYGIASGNRGEYQPLLTYLAMFDILRQHSINGKALELGGGYSTLLLLEYVQNGMIELESIDMNPSKYLYLLPSQKARKFLFGKVKITKRITVSKSEVFNAFLTILPLEIKKIGIDKFNQSLINFIRDDDPYKHINLFRNEQIGGYLLTLDGWKEEEKFYQQADIKDNYCTQLKNSNIIYNIIFFDCGEYSSLAEWFILENQIRIGGFVLLHDIYYPKSVKNFIVAALISVSSKWEILYIDNYSKQGGLVARRI